MLYRGVGDTYSRFLSPRELDTMRKYDITGVGLNLGTAEECRRRTVCGCLAGCLWVGRGGRVGSVFMGVYGCLWVGGGG